MVSTAVKKSMMHHISLYIALLITLVTAVMAIVYVVETQKRCKNYPKNKHMSNKNQMDLGWTLVGLAAVDILLIIIIYGSLDYTRFL